MGGGSAASARGSQIDQGQIMMGKKRLNTFLSIGGFEM
jgi:hypothetical protein